MKVFLSWSGSVSRLVACAFRDWLPSVIQTVDPYVSSEDIDKGARWATDIAKELEESSFGLLFVTSDNVDAPWINFEAGALSKTVDKSRVAPFLFGIKRSEIKEGPLLQFQSTIHEKDDIEKLVSSINNGQKEDERLEDSRVKKSVEVWWPQLEQQLMRIRESNLSENDAQSMEAVGSDSVILEELLELARNQQRMLQSPDMLLPPDYLDHVLRTGRGRSFGDEPWQRQVVDDLVRGWSRIQDIVAHPANDETRLELTRALRALSEPVLMLAQRCGVDTSLTRHVARARRLSEEFDRMSEEESFRNGKSHSDGSSSIP